MLFILYVKPNGVCFKYRDNDNNELITYINSVTEYNDFIFKKADDFGVSPTDLRICHSSSMNFPEDETNDQDVIDLAYKLINPKVNNMDAVHELLSKESEDMNQRVNEKANNIVEEIKEDEAHRIVQNLDKDNK